MKNLWKFVISVALGRVVTYYVGTLMRDCAFMSKQHLNLNQIGLMLE